MIIAGGILNNSNITTQHSSQRKSMNFSKQTKAGYVVYEEANFYIDSRYKIQNVLGKGSYGTVCSAIDAYNKDKPVSIAIKKVSNIFNKEVLLKRAVRELKLMRFFKGHRNVTLILLI